MSLAALVAGLALAAWLYLLFGRGFFWLPLWPDPVAAPERWPRIAAIVPARNEAAVVAAAIGSLLVQDYPGAFSVTLVDDGSEDGTAEIARAEAARLGRSDRLAVVAARPLPPGWSGKLWAMSEGVAAVEAAGEPPEALFFTDADIVHSPSHLAMLAARLEGERRDLVSEMVLLRCRSLAERFLIPPFVFFFAMLYPFAWSNDPRRRTAAAAGGTMLLRRSAYGRIGGLAAIRAALIDDCALAKAVKQSGGSVWLGLTKETRSLRPYPRLRDIWRMVARTAYAQLRYSPLLLAGTVAGLALVYLAPVALVFAGGAASWLAVAAWVAMSLAFLPMVLFYRLAPLWALLLPAAALVYLAATVDSARRHWQGTGGEWKGRVAWRHRK
ncbi:MAG TPA: glycosyltransferase [Stellaceae bacterium]|nr:glycosyltransferase [Stellaceae bacterium]